MDSALNRIPEFPDFAPLHISQREEIESFVSQFAPYSDFNFVSLLTWDVHGEGKVSWLFGNLVVQFTDYLTREIFLTFLGTNKVHETLQELSSFAQKQNLSTTLRLVPEELLSHLPAIDGLETTEDEDSHDYILHVEDLVTYKGNKLGPKRNFVNRFLRAYGEEAQTKEIDITEKPVQKDILALFDTWHKKSEKPLAEVIDERKAIERLLAFAPKLNIFATGVYHGDDLIGFSINESVHDDFGVIHYEKADADYVGVYPYLKQQAAHHFREKGCTHINYEQDMGLLWLRKAKRAYKPVRMLKKYILTLPDF